MYIGHEEFAVIQSHYLMPFLLLWFYFKTLTYRQIVLLFITMLPKGLVMYGSLTQPAQVTRVTLALCPISSADSVLTVRFPFHIALLTVSIRKGTLALRCLLHEH